MRSTGTGLLRSAKVNGGWCPVGLVVTALQAHIKYVTPHRDRLIRYLSYYPGPLSLAIPPWLGAEYRRLPPCPLDKKRYVSFTEYMSC